MYTHLAEYNLFYCFWPDGSVKLTVSPFIF
jgi:hypothetical protein